MKRERHQFHAFICVSIDLDISCLCCGKGHDEFKCPCSSKDQIPSDSNLPYLEVDENEKIMLKKNSDYYYQVHGQMGVTGGKYTDFFVFTFKGYHQERVFFDENSGVHYCKNLFGFGGNLLAQK